MVLRVACCVLRVLRVACVACCTLHVACGDLRLLCVGLAVVHASLYYCVK